MTARITLLTDFGTVDGYVAAVKGVAASLAPGVVVEDASHEIPRGDVFAAAIALERYWRLYPRHTVHCVVVDPGVGTARKPIAVEADERFVVAPDNGVVTRVVTGAGTWRAVELIPEKVPGTGVSTTFHGRDIFAPAAASLAQGRSLDSMGRPLKDVVRLDWPEPIREREGITGRVIHVDRFGNLVTNVPGDLIRVSDVVEIEGRTVPFRASYGMASPGELLALVNSDGRLEVAERDGSAAGTLGIGPGQAVKVSR
jgi:S-adenosylmethionine hydrolase